MNVDTVAVMCGAWKSQTFTRSYSRMLLNHLAPLSFSFGFWTVQVTNILQTVQKALWNITE